MRVSVAWRVREQSDIVLAVNIGKLLGIMWKNN